MTAKEYIECGKSTTCRLVDAINSLNHAAVDATHTTCIYRIFRIAIDRVY